MSGDPESSETSSAPSFSWSQVVRKDKKVAQHPTTTEVARDEAPAPALNLSGPPLSESLNKVQDKMAAATVAEASASAAPALAPSTQDQGHQQAASFVGTEKAAPSKAVAADIQAPSAASEVPRSESQAEQQQPSSPADLKPVEVKSVWVGQGGRQSDGSGSAAADSPVAVKVLSTSSQSWPTLGDSKTEPQKRGLPEVVPAASAHANNSQQEGRGRGKKGNRGGDYTNSRNNNNSGNASGSKHNRGRQNGGYKGNNNGGASQSGASGGHPNQNGFPGNGSAHHQNRNYRNRGNQNARKNNANAGGQNLQQVNGGHMKHSGGGQMNGMKGSGGGGAGMGQQAGYYMPVYYAPMPGGNVSGAPMYMMPPHQTMVNPSAQPVAGGGTSPSQQGQGTSNDTILEAVKVQVEYYFSVQNLVKDMFLRAKMDDGGWIPVAVIAAFNRVRALAPNPNMIAAALQSSTLVEVSSDSESIRCKENWESWVLPRERRDPSGPQAKRPQSSPGSPVPVGMGGAMPTTGMAMAAMFPCTEISDEVVERVTLIARLASGDPVKDSEALVMTNDVAAMVNNGIAVLESQVRQQMAKDAAQLPLVSNHFYPIAPMLSQTQKKDQAKNQMPLVAPSTFGSHVGWMFASQSRQDKQAPASAPCEDGANGPVDQGVAHQSIGDFGHPAYTYFQTNGYAQIKYKDFRDACLQKRTERAGAAKSANPAAGTHAPEMYTLYQFWGLFLRDVFNLSMYEDFKKCALSDHNEGQGSFGITCLFGLYHNRLLKEFRPVLFNDFEEIVKEEYKKGNAQVMMEFNAFCVSTGLVKPGAQQQEVAVQHQQQQQQQEANVTTSQ